MELSQRQLIMHCSLNFGFFYSALRMIDNEWILVAWFKLLSFMRM